MKGAFKRWWRRRRGVPFTILYAKGAPKTGKLIVAIEIPDDYETWEAVLECRRLAP